MKKRYSILVFIAILALTLLLTSTGLADEDIPSTPEAPPKPIAYPWVVRPDLFNPGDPEETSPFEPKIVGGTITSPNEYPWVVSLQYGGQHYCGGTLIDEEWILTSAHCWTDQNGNEFQIDPVNDRAVLGEHQLSVSSEEEQVLPIAEVHRHPYYNYSTFEYDVAMLKLGTPATINDEVDTIGLVGQNPGNLNYKSSVITGWGYTYYQEGIPSDYLREASIQILPDTWCNSYGSAFKSSTMLCAGTTNYSKDTCQGDSGGPLVYDNGGEFVVAGITSWGYRCAEPNFPGIYARVSTVSQWIDSYANSEFQGGIEIESNQPIVAISRPHILSEIMAYNGASAGATTVYLPMLFNEKWNYTSSFTVQNLGASTATYSLTFRDADNGSTTCELNGESLPQHGIRTYDVGDLGGCSSGTMPTDWFGGATISSNQPVSAVAKPDINGTDAVTYTSFTGGASTAYLPMLFRGKFGYQSAIYVQNLHGSTNATLSIDFYDTDGNFTCTYSDVDSLSPSETRGYWMAGLTGCSGGTGFDAAGWAGSAVINSSGSDNIVAIGRPHMGTEVAAYNGFTSGNTTNYLPMLFRGIYGYNAAFYIQNISTNPTTVEITFYDTDGNEVCIFDDPETLGQNATRGYWTPVLNCNDGRNFDPAGWAGSAKIITDENVIAVGRPHLSDGQVVVYNSFTGGTSNAYLPMNFWYWHGNETALYIQNLGGSVANTTISFYDEDDGYLCSMDKDIAPGSSGAIWLKAIPDGTCVP